MIRNNAYDPQLSLVELNNQITEFEGGFGALIGLGNQDGETIGVHDDTAESKGVVLKPGLPIRKPGKLVPVPVTGQVFILGQLQTVTAYHEA